MILSLHKVTSRIAILHNVPKTFFKKIEESHGFGDHLFPKWSIDVFAQTQLKAKFEIVYLAYKALPHKEDRDLVINAFQYSNQIEKLCYNNPNVPMIVLNDLPITIRQPLDNLFFYLYNNATKHPGFQTYTKTSLFKSIDKFIIEHKIQVCPFCGLESFTNIEGQPRLPLDHWLNRDIFPFASVNFNNLVPIGKDCNSTGVKGSKNVLIDSPESNQRIVSYYPYTENHGVVTRFSYINEPKIDGVKDEDWQFQFSLREATEEAVYNSWSSTFNIDTRYKDYIRKNILAMWESEYKRFVEKHAVLSPANDLIIFKSNLAHWKSSFDMESRPGSLAYLSFIDHLLEKDDAYLTGLYKTFYSEYINTIN